MTVVGAAHNEAPTRAVPRCDPAGSGRITQLLLACRQGDEEAYRQLMSLVYGDLRRIACQQLRRHQPHVTLNTTGLVHELYLKLLGNARIPCRDRSHFLALSARAMRQIIVDYARSRNTQKRRALSPHVRFDEIRLAADRQGRMLVALDEALAGLAELDERLIQVVECRFFAGYSEEETAEALSVCTRTVERDWKRARAWLEHEIGDS
jgi:RNA polymerase sigma factor (TIGR02999 family)